MAEGCYTARATTKQQVLNGIDKLTLQTNKHGQYTHDATFSVSSSANSTQVTLAKA
jgi:hypothetical protein